MLKLALTLTILPFFIFSHCQMPCGIYHDQMIYDKVDEYYQTMYKAMSVLDDNAFQSSQEKNTFIRWVNTKEHMSDEIGSILTTYFLQQKITPSEDPDTQHLVHTIHQLLFLAVAIKQQVNLQPVIEFGKTWDQFKTLFHPDMDCENRWEEAFGTEKHQKSSPDSKPKEKTP